MVTILIFYHSIANQLKCYMRNWLTTLAASVALLFEKRLDFLLPDVAPPSCPTTSQNASG